VLLGRRQHQELLGEPAKPVSLLADRSRGCPKIIILGRSRLGELDLGLDDGQWRTQLVAGVGQKPALLIQHVALRGLRPRNSIKHVVERKSESSDLVGNRRDRQRCPFTVGQVVAADGCRPLPQRLDRTQGEPGHPVADTT